MNFQKAIVRLPCERLLEGITTARLGKPDYQNALRQHQMYTETLVKCGLQVEVLPLDERFPDSTFVEDVAVLIPGCAIVTRPGALSRRREVEAIEPVLKKYFTRIEKISSPGTLDGGDVLQAGSHFYIGLSQRTNANGSAQLIEILKNHDFTGSTVPLREMLHLKSGIAFLENGRVVVSGEMVDHPVFRDFPQIKVIARESYAANCLWINRKVLVAAGFPRTAAAIRQEGYPVTELDVSEFRKLDGGLSCLSLRF